MGRYRICSDCSKLFGCNKSRRRHVHKTHGPLSDICSACKPPEPFLSTSALNDHNRDKHGLSISLAQDDPIPGFSTRLNIGFSTTARFTSSSFGSSTSASISFAKSLFGVGVPTSPCRPASSHFSATTFTSTRSLDALTSTDNLDDLVAVTVQPDYDFLSECDSAVEKIVHLLQNNVNESLRPRRVIKGGSLGKGTAVKGKSDIDLVLMLKEYRDVRSLTRNLSSVIASLKSCFNNFPGIHVKRTTPYCVQLEYSHGSGEKLAIDVLPAVDCLEINGKQQVFEMMRGRDSNIQRNYSPSLTPLQVQLFSPLPTKLKSLIRLVKYWKKEKGQNSARDWPTSYVLELVTLAAWTKAGSPEKFDLRKGLCAVLHSLINHEDFAEDFDEHRFYDESILSRLPKPYIIDPCNPFNNVYLKPYQRAAWDWGSIASAASETIQQPRLARVILNSLDWQ